MTQLNDGQRPDGPRTGATTQPGRPSQSPIPEQWLSTSGPASRPEIPQQWSPRSQIYGVPSEGGAYPNLWRAPGIRRGRTVGAFFLGVLGLLLATALAGLLVSAAYGQLRNSSDDWFTSDRVDVTLLLPAMIANSIAFALLIPLSFVLSRLVGQKGNWLSSVAGRVRWPWFLRILVISLFVSAAYVVLATSVGGGSLGFRAGTWWLLAVALVLLPVSAAGMEYLARGVLNRGAASLAGHPSVGAVLGAVVSTAMLLLVSTPQLIYRNDGLGAVKLVVLSLLLSYLAWRTGGLEAGVAVSVAYSLILYAPMFFTGTEVLERSWGAFPAELLTLIPVVFVVALTGVEMRTQRLQRTADPERVEGKP